LSHLESTSGKDGGSAANGEGTEAFRVTRHSCKKACAYACLTERDGGGIKEDRVVVWVHVGKEGWGARETSTRVREKGWSTILGRNPGGRKKVCRSRMGGGTSGGRGKAITLALSTASYQNREYEGSSRFDGSEGRKRNRVSKADENHQRTPLPKEISTNRGPGRQERGEGKYFSLPNLIAIASEP